jgi:RHS repeat-associated protein
MSVAKRLLLIAMPVIVLVSISSTGFGSGLLHTAPTVRLSDTQLTSSTANPLQNLTETYGGTNPEETCAGCESWGTSQHGVSTPPDTTATDLVNTATGDVNESYTLFSAPSVGNDFYYRMSYDSDYASAYAKEGLSYAGAYGWGWVSNFNTNVVEVTVDSDTAAVVTLPTGAELGFYEEINSKCPTGSLIPTEIVPDPWGSNLPVYCAMPDVNAALVWNSTQEAYTLYQDIGSSVTLPNGGLTNLTYTSNNDGLTGSLVAEGTAFYPYLLDYTTNVAEGASTCPQNGGGQVSGCAVATDALSSRYLSTEFSADGLAVDVIDPAGHDWDFGYTSSLIDGVPKTNNELISITDPNGNSWGFAYDTSAPTDYIYGLTSITDPDNNVTALAYDTSSDANEGVVNSVTDAMGNQTTYSWPSGTSECGACLGPNQSQKVAVTDASGDRSTYNYFVGILTSQVQSTTSTTWSYATLTNTTSYDYVWTGYPIQTILTTIEPSGTEAIDTYSSVGDLLSDEIKPTSGATSTTNYDYNSFNEQCWEAQPGISVTGATCLAPPASSTSETYNSWGDLLSSTDPLGDATDYGYNSDGQLCWKTLADQNPGSGPTCPAPPPAASTYDYNSSNELVSTSTPDGTSPNFTHDTTNNTYNAYGEVLTSVSPDGYVSGNTAAEYTTTNNYDPAGRLYQVAAPFSASTSATTIATLDAAGNLVQVTDPMEQVTTNEFDADNRLCWSVDASVNTQTYDKCSTVPPDATTYVYRAGTSDVTEMVDPDKNPTYTTYYDPFFPDQPTSVTDASGNVTSNVYDDLGNLCVSGSTSTSLYAGGATPTCSWSLNYTYKTYDPFNNVTSVTDPGGANQIGNVTDYTYGDATYPTVATVVSPPAPEAATTNTYNPAGQLTNTVQGSTAISASYTPTGNVCWRSPIDVAINSQDLPTSSCLDPPSSVTGTTGTSFYSYYASELFGLMKDVTSTGDNDTAWVYDAQGRLTQEDVGTNAINYVDNAAGDNTCISYPITGNTPNCADAPSDSLGDINTVVDYAYDADGRMTYETPWTGNQLNFSYYDPYTARNEVTNITGYPTAVDTPAESMSYDPADNLLDVSLGGVPVPTYDFTDTLTPNSNDLIATDNSNSYTYSPYDQVLKTGTGLDTFSNNPNGEISSDLVGSYGTSFSYNGADELTSSTYTTASSSSTTSYGFDAEGNRCASVSGTTQPGCATPPGTATTSGYTAYNQLCWTGEGGSSSGEGSCSAPPGGATTYSYNGQGLRVSDTAGQNGTTQNFLYDTETRSGQPLVMMDGTNAYIYGPPTFGSGTAPLEQVPLNGNPISYLMSDQNGVRVLLGALDVVNQAYGYSTYGVRTGNSLLLGTTPFGFQGGYTDPSNLIYYVDRYYDPATDQFISVDPDVGATGQPYAFTGDDPINGNDPLGLLGNCGGQPGDCVQTGGHPTIANPQSSSSSSASGGVYLDQPTPTVVVASAGGFETTVSGDVTFSGTKTKTTAGISPNGDIQAQIGQFDLTFAPNGVAQAEVDIHNCSGSFSHAGLSWSCTKSYTGTSGPVTATASITVTFQVTPSEQAQAAEQRELSLYPEFAAVGAAIVTGGAQIIAGCISGSDAVCIAPA